MEKAAAQRTKERGGEPVPALPSNLKIQNRKMVLSCFRDNRPHSVADVVARTGISKLTVMKAIQFFCGKGILASSGKGDSTELGGKKPECFRFSCGKYLLTIRMWPEDLGLTLFDMRMNKVDSSHLAWIIPDAPEEAFRIIENSALALLARAGVDREELYGVSLSSSGIVDYDHLTLKYSVHTPNWGANVPIGDYLRGIFGPGPALSEENAGKSISRAILNEQEDPNRSILVLFTSWGLSGALIQDGRILNGRNSLVGEIGHMILDQNDPELCSCGSRGCAERLVSVARVRKMIAGDPPPEGSPLSRLPAEAVELRHLFASSRQEDAYARKYVAYMADRFAALLRNVSLVFSPEKVVFVGDYAVADEYFDQRMRQQLSAFRYLSLSQPMEIVYDTRSLTGLDALGGAAALIDHYLSRPELYEETGS